MPDVDLRQLERAAAQGDREAGERLLRERLRRGLLDEERIALAAWLGDPAAQALRPGAAPAEHVDLVWFLDRLADWGRLTAARGACAFARWLAPEPEHLGSVRLVVQGDPSAIQVLVAGRSLVVGRGRQVDLRIREDESVSRRHCEVRLDTDGRASVRDLDSKNGTWLGSEVVGGTPARVFDGDLIRIGGSAVEVRGARGRSGEGWLDAALTFLEAPGPAGYERVAAAVQPTDPSRLQPGDQAALGAALTILAADPAPGTQIGIELTDDADARRAVARALLPHALRQEPLERVEEPPASLIRGPRVAPLDYRFRIAQDLLAPLGLRPVRRLNASQRGPILARSADGTLEAVTVLDEVDADSEVWTAFRALELGEVRHPHLLGYLGLHDQVSRDGLAVIRARFVRGYSLPEWVRRPSASDLGFVVRGFRDLCGAARAALVVVSSLSHRPDSVRFGLDGRLYLTDVLADQVQRDLDESSVDHFQPYVALAHISPEEAAGEERVEPNACAVYRLGSFLFLAATGRPAFPSQSARALLAILDEPPPAPSSIRAEISPELDAVILRCLEKDPAARYPDPLALAAALAETPEGRD